MKFNLTCLKTIKTTGTKKARFGHAGLGHTNLIPWIAGALNLALGADDK
jgi:hypothetical protein